MKVVVHPIDAALARLAKLVTDTERGGASNVVVSVEDLRFAIEELERMDVLPVGTV